MEKANEETTTDVVVVDVVDVVEGSGVFGVLEDGGTVGQVPVVFDAVLAHVVAGGRLGRAQLEDQVAEVALLRRPLPHQRARVAHLGRSCNRPLIHFLSLLLIFQLFFLIFFIVEHLFLFSTVLSIFSLMFQDFPNFPRVFAIFPYFPYFFFKTFLAV